MYLPVISKMLFCYFDTKSLCQQWLSFAILLFSCTTHAQVVSVSKFGQVHKFTAPDRTGTSVNLPNTTVVVENILAPVKRADTTTNGTNSIGRFTVNFNLNNDPGGQFQLKTTWSRGDSANLGVNAADANMLQQHILGLLPPSIFTALSKIAADVDNSGALDNADRILINQVILGTKTAFPIPAWRYFPMWYAWDSTFYANFSKNPFGTFPTRFPPAKPVSYLGGSGVPSYLVTANGFKMPAPLPSNTTTLNYSIAMSAVGIKSGDVDYSYTPTASTGRIIAEKTKSVIRLEASKQLKKGVRATIAFKSDTIIKGITALQIGVNYDKSKVKIKSVAASKLNLLPSEHYHIIDSTGQLRIVWVDAAGKKVDFTGENIFQIEVEILEDTLFDELTFSINGDNIETMFLDKYNDRQAFNLRRVLVR